MRPEGVERRGGPSRRSGRGLRTVAVGVALIGVGVVAVALWSAASKAEAAEPEAQRTARRGASFSSFIDDLPIMPGLSESDGGYAFDLSEGGRLAEARLGGAADAAVVRGFYAATLAQLGWRPAEHEPYVYHRGGEQLIFLVEPAPARRGGPRRLEAVFVITPEDSSAAGQAATAARLH